MCHEAAYHLRPILPLLLCVPHSSRFLSPKAIAPLPAMCPLTHNSVHMLVLRYLKGQSTCLISSSPSALYFLVCFNGSSHLTHLGSVLEQHMWF